MENEKRRGATVEGLWRLRRRNWPELERLRLETGARRGPENLKREEGEGRRKADKRRDPRPRRCRSRRGRKETGPRRGWT